MSVTYEEVQKARAKAIALGLRWNETPSNGRFQDYYQAWLKYQAMDVELARIEIKGE